jgi:rhodanese-related sulfurtransferase
MKRLSLVFFLLAFWSCSRSGLESSASLLSPQAFSDQLKMNGAILLDVRTPEEMQTGFLKGAQNLDYSSGSFESALDSLDHSGKYLVYCASGKRSGKALDLMRSKGFQNVAAMEGGLNAWKAAGLPVELP